MVAHARKIFVQLLIALAAQKVSDLLFLPALRQSTGKAWAGDYNGACRAKFRLTLHYPLVLQLPHCLSSEDQLQSTIHRSAATVYRLISADECLLYGVFRLSLHYLPCLDPRSAPAVRFILISGQPFKAQVKIAAS